LNSWDHWQELPCLVYWLRLGREGRSHSLFIFFLFLELKQNLGIPFKMIFPHLCSATSAFTFHFLHPLHTHYSDFRSPFPHKDSCSHLSFPRSNILNQVHLLSPRIKTIC
jgi:hypothetical protein